MKIRGKLISSFGAVTLVILLGYAFVVYLSFTESIRRDQTKIYNLQVKNSVLLTEHLFWRQVHKLIGTGPEGQFDAAASQSPAGSRDEGLFRGYAVYVRETGKRLKIWPHALSGSDLSRIGERLAGRQDLDSPRLFFDGKEIFFILQEKEEPARHLFYLFQVDRGRLTHLLQGNLLLHRATLLLSRDGRMRMIVGDKDPVVGGLARPRQFSKMLRQEKKAGIDQEGRFVPFANDMFLFSAPIDFFGLHLDYFLPRGIFLSALDRLKNRVFAATLILGWIAAWVILIVASRLSRPMVNLARVTNDMITFNYQTPFEFAPNNDEIGDLARSVETMRQRIEQLVTKDHLTKTYNRRYLMHMFKLEHAKAARNRGELACLILDLDHFKQVNDTYGHQVGDEVLQEMGGLLMNNIRNYDTVATVARYGGEEFVVLLPGISKEGAAIVAERLRRKVEEHAMPEDIVCTVSCGVALLDADRHDSPDDLLRDADQALYLAKKQGRNRVIVAT